ncbi:MAG TPA: polysaccharide biosynthesis/export family protein [Planctomycetota bacterium]|nr:polysaccharide biosynthesis/export family protein [Planctomycetota bacterium]
MTGCLRPRPSVPATEHRYQYRVGAGDLLRVEVFREQALHEDVVVAPDGTFMFPLAGTITARDRTLSEVADAIAAGLRNAQQIVISNVTVQLKESKSAQVSVIGETARQLRIPFRESMTACDAILEAGGPQWPTAKTEDTRVIRGRLDDPTIIELDLEDVLVGGAKDVVLQPGDIVVVPAKHVTVFARWSQQLVSPIGAMVGAGMSATGRAAAP